MARKREVNTADTLPCRHPDFTGKRDQVIDLLQRLHGVAPSLLLSRGVGLDEYPMLLRAAVESLRGTAAATTADKRKFVETILEYGRSKGAFRSWKFVGSQNRQDYKVELPDGTLVAIEAKGCPDGNNMTIWDRPLWAEEFVVWSLCPQSLVKQPGEGAWSGIANRLLPKVQAERERARVDAMIFWDGRCGSSWRRCPKKYGVEGEGLRARACDIPGQDDRDWLPPPCIFLLPQSPANIRNNKTPKVHTVDTCKFAKALLLLFRVPEAELAHYVHTVTLEARGTDSGIEIKVSVTSRCWADGKERVVAGNWKDLNRE